MENIFEKKCRNIHRQPKILAAITGKKKERKTNKKYDKTELGLKYKHHTKAFSSRVCLYI